MNITRKYRVASSAIVSRIEGILNLDDLDVIAKKIVNENARKSGLYASSAWLTPPVLNLRVLHTIEEGNTHRSHL